MVFNGKLLVNFKLYEGIIWSVRVHSGGFDRLSLTVVSIAGIDRMI